MTFSKKIQPLTVVIPAYNEEQIILKSITLLVEQLQLFAQDFEVIVVDDGSSDRTAQILTELANKDNRIKLLENGKNQGLGFSLRMGFEQARNELIFYCDADMPIDYQMIYNCAVLMEERKIDFISGFRTNRGPEPLYRKIYSLLYNWLICFVFKVAIKDVNFSLKLFKKCVLGQLKLKSNGSFIDAEMLVKTIYAGYRFEQIDAKYFPRTAGASHLATPRVILGILWELIKYYKEIAALKIQNEKTNH